MVPLAIPLNNDTVSPGFLGFGVVVALWIALYFLIRSMNRQISRIEAPKEADLEQAEWEAAQAQAQAKPPVEKGA
jgi:Na+-transporting methylmalonyl-CoA/oxaloacetate decarboxylase gamma subunit